MYMSVSGIDLYTTPGSERSSICLLAVSIRIPLQEVSGHVTANRHIDDRSLSGVVYKSIPLTDI
jgi:hypothetical protein